MDIKPKDLPKIVGSLYVRSLFVDRVDEQANLRAWLTGNSKKVVVIKAASGYGKTSLAMEVLHALAPDKRLDDKIGGLLVFLCRESNERDFAAVCRKADELLGKNQNTFVRRYAAFIEQTQGSPDALPSGIAADLINGLGSLGNVWLVFDNFEAVLQNGEIGETHLREFFEQALQKSGLHFLLTSQIVPQFGNRIEIEEVAIGDLPAEFALDFWQREGATLKAARNDCGLAEITREDLERLTALNFMFVPIALVAFAGYLKSNYLKRGEVLAQVLRDETLFERFRTHDAKEGLRYLIERQYQALSADERTILKTLSIFNEAVSFPTLEEILKERLNEQAIYTVLTGNSLVRRTGANFYELLPEARTVIAAQTDKDEHLTRQQTHIRAAQHYYSIRQPIENCYTRKQFAPYFNTIDHYIKAGIYDAAVPVLNESILRLVALGYMREIIGRCHALAGKLGQPELEANNFFNLGLAFDSLGKPNEAVAEYDRAIEILDELVNQQGRVELANGLAKAYMNKGNALSSLGKLNEAIEIYGEAVSLWEESLQRGELHNLPTLIKCFRNRVEVLIKLEDWERTAVDFNKAVGLGLPLLQSDEFSEHFKQLIKDEINLILRMLCQLSPDKRAEIYLHAGEDGEYMRELVEDFCSQMNDAPVGD